MGGGTNGGLFLNFTGLPHHQLWGGAGGGGVGPGPDADAGELWGSLNFSAAAALFVNSLLEARQRGQ